MPATGAATIGDGRAGGGKQSCDLVGGEHAGIDLQVIQQPIVAIVIAGQTGVGVSRVGQRTDGQKQRIIQQVGRARELKLSSTPSM